ncbi:MAG: hypothetical protein KDB23_05895 [Planctomycetales bacterium]|nr:hypothetical protein [Planctomycetales bacterium]
MRTFLIAMCVTVTIAGAAVAADFHPIASVTSSTADTDLWPASNLIQGPGVGIDAAAPHDKLLGAADGNWVTDACGFPCDYIETTGAPSLTFDLGADTDLSEISVWGYTTTNSNGVKDFNLTFGTDAGGMAGIGSSITYNPSFSMELEDIARQSFSFDSVMARYVTLTATDNYFSPPGDGSAGELAGGDRVGLGEVAFAVVPEPSSLSLLVIGMLPFLRRRS